jgi:hypothetical protein
MKICFSPTYIDDVVIDEVILKPVKITTGFQMKALEAGIKNLTSTEEVICVNS